MYIYCGNVKYIEKQEKRYQNLEMILLNFGLFISSHFVIIGFILFYIVATILSICFLYTVFHLIFSISISPINCKVCVTIILLASVK